jgi:hypothetical protein
MGIKARRERKWPTGMRIKEDSLAEAAAKWNRNEGRQILNMENFRKVL